MKLIINGESVDISGGADVNVTVLTEEEFNTLPEFEQNNGVYFISGEVDSGNSGGSSESLDVYSTEEKRIGTWIDGKPLYRKVAIFNVSENATGITPTFDLLDGTEVKKYDAYARLQNMLDIPIPYFYSLDNYISVNFSQTVSTQGHKPGVYIQYSGSHFTNSQVTMILEYTKTTDQPEVTA